MRTSPLLVLADFIHARGCKPICAKLLTLPWTERSDAKTAGCYNLQSTVPPRRAHEYMAVRLCIEVRHSCRMDFCGAVGLYIS